MLVNYFINMDRLMDLIKNFDSLTPSSREVITTCMSDNNAMVCFRIKKINFGFICDYPEIYPFTLVLAISPPKFTGIYANP